MYAYNPRKKSSQELEKSLVGDDRWDTLNNILREMALKKGEGPKQHWMLIGPRGIGKSHLLTLLYYKITGNQKLSKLWIPILFPENLLMAGNLTKFLERVANEILIEFDQEKKPISHEMKQKIQKIRKVPLKERADYLFSILSWVHRKTGKYILLITENLQQLLGKKIIPIEQKKLRAFLQTSDAVLIIGSATTIFDALHDHSHPFYHFFHIRRLEDLSFDDMKTLIISLLSESEQPELIKEVEDRDARLKALYSFAGGNPRMAVFLSDIIRTEVPDEMLELMDNILDQLTPYFEAILNDIPDYLEEIINTLAAFEPAQSPREIAEHLEAPQATIRNYLKQLKEAGYVRIAFSKGKSNYYCLNEYLYRIWYQMRDSSHREEARWLMELLLMLYSPDKIIKERNKVKASVQKEEAAFSYEKLIVQAADFIARYPDTCMIIESCVNFAKDNKKGEIIYEKEKELLKEALKYIKDNQYDQAIKLCKDAIKNNPKFEDGYLVWGICLKYQGRYEEAIKKYKQAVKINPKSEDAYWQWGACLREQKLYEEAIEKFKKAINIDLKSYASYGAIGDCYKFMGRYVKAEEQYKKAIDINDIYEDAHIALGNCLQLQGRYEEAIKKYKQAIKNNPKSEAAYRQWGACLQEQELYEEAIKKYKQAIKINPKSEAAYGQWGICLQEQELYEEAIKKYKQAIKINPKSEYAYRQWGICLREQKLYEEAINQYKQAIKINPKYERAFWGWGACLRDQERYKEAIEKFKEAIKIDSKSYASYGAMGDCFRELSLYDEAEKKYKKAIEINNEYEDAYSAWGACLRKQERYDEAIVKFQKAIEINPKSKRAYWVWGAILRDQEHYKEAIEKFKEAIKIDSKSYASYGAMGDCFRELSLYDEAEKKYKKAIEINNEYEDAYSAWGTCLRKQERYEEAIEKFKQAIKINPESEYNYLFWAICLMKLERYDEAIKIFERLINIQPEYYQVYLPYGQLLEKKQDKELALLAYLKHISFGSMAISRDFDFQKIYNEQIIPLLKALKPGKYIKQFYATENDRKFPEPILSIFLILLAKYDTVSENIQDIVKTYLEKEDEEINDFNLFIFTIKLSVWLKLCEGNLSDGLRLVDLYIEYIKSLKSAKEKENEVSNFSMGLFRVQINLGIDPQNTKKILNRLKSADDVPFSDVLLKIWTCISEPDSVDAQRYLSDKAIADVVMELRADDSTSKT